MEAEDATKSLWSDPHGRGEELDQSALRETGGLRNVPDARLGESQRVQRVRDNRMRAARVEPRHELRFENREPLGRRRRGTQPLAKRSRAATPDVFEIHVAIHQLAGRHAEDDARLTGPEVNADDRRVTYVVSAFRRISYLRGISISVGRAFAATSRSLNASGKYSPAAHSFARSAKCGLSRRSAWPGPF